MHPLLERAMTTTRRQFFSRAATGVGIGTAALASLLNQPLSTAAESASAEGADGGLPGMPHFAPRAKRVIYLCQSGGPSQFETFDYKPELAKLFDQDVPKSVFGSQRLTGMTSGQARFAVTPSYYKFKQHGESGTWVSELLPRLAEIIDELCLIKSVHTEAINHDPAITFFQTGSQQPGRPSFGAWVNYGLGSENQNLPAFVVMNSMGTGRPVGQPLYARLWGSGFLPSSYQGVQFRSVGDPVMYLSNPPGLDETGRRELLDGLAQINQLQQAQFGDPEIATRIASFEMAYRMQTSVPELIDVSGETKQTLEMYGDDVAKPGTYARNCLLARRLAERGVRFIQLYHRGWDQHGDLVPQISRQCHDVDQPTAALIKDLKQRGMLEDTLIIWGGEFGRTVYSQGTLTKDNYGRDHHPRCFTMFLAGGGSKGGYSHGATDDFSYNITEAPLHVHDLNATILHLLGIDHERLTYRFQGRDFRLTDVHGTVVSELIG
ncbi:hypothetical protein Pan258_26730 [Symmachiella dynata]|uniref:DUF1501 domain-containing protein n=1 Tax=Symmachiella dynata TaxID=2527995 RepID=UPI00118BB809|nr:DUF1501 domain-containing protein [Symmachiella dynata]QDT48631.1 hypothetical protein Pan258_26730 [Symmachiella dynata]